MVKVTIRTGISIRDTPSRPCEADVDCTSYDDLLSSCAVATGEERINKVYLVVGPDDSLQPLGRDNYLDKVQEDCELYVLVGGTAGAGPGAAPGAVLATSEQTGFDVFSKQLADSLREMIKPVADGIGILLDRQEELGITPSRGGGNDNTRPSSSGGEPPGDARPNKKGRLGGGSGAVHGSHCVGYNREAMLQAGAVFKQRLLHDSDLQRDIEAGFSAAMVEFLRTPSGHKGLLGLDRPPSTIQLPSFLEMLSRPKQEYAAMVVAAMSGARSGDDVSSSVDQA